VRRLREKIEDDPTRPSVLKTVWGVGYRLDPSDEEESADADL
jgi:DNA-binding response OmpR family regulator